MIGSWSFSEWWRTSSLAVKLDALVALVLIPLLILVSFLAATANRVQEVTILAGRYRQMVFDLSDLKVSLLNVETGARGYALTLAPQFLEPYQSGLDKTRVLMEKVKQDEMFRAEVQPLLEKSRAYLAWAKRSTENPKPDDRQVQQAVWVEGKGMFDVLRQELDGLTERYRDQFTTTRDLVLADIGVMRLLPWGMLILVLAGAITVRYGLRQLVVGPLRALETVSVRQTSGERSARASIQYQDEIGRLAEVLNTNADVIERRDAELLRSNTDLEQFAYVASHDLQEPLRMISSYTQLLEKRYRGQLDERANQYIHFAVDGANRMQTLIQDLLAFSRLGTRQGRIEPVNTESLLQEVLHTLDSRVTEASAEVVVGELPNIIHADKGQISQVFQNLIGNALKFRREGVKHRVEVSATTTGEFYQFTVLDNGIGIAPEFFERIFTIFQRLHSREAYSGSGIGLSIVKRIVERHGGRVWLESTPNEGAAFYFTLPVEPPTKDAHEPRHD